MMSLYQILCAGELFGCDPGYEQRTPVQDNRSELLEMGCFHRSLEGNTPMVVASWQRYHLLGCRKMV
jgi:hypothetical protein